jgi:hypothetical protein
MYDHNEFERVGIRVENMEYPDGTNPSNTMIKCFIQLCDREISRGKAVAVHCRAGLGRTGTLIALFLMLKFDQDARTCIAWCRLCRPGSIVGDQQQFLDELDREGNIYSIMNGVNYGRNPHERQQRRDAIREQMNYDISEPVTIYERELDGARPPAIFENPESPVDFYEKRLARYEPLRRSMERESGYQSPSEYPKSYPQALRRKNRSPSNELPKR